MEDDPVFGELLAIVKEEKLDEGFPTPEDAVRHIREGSVRGEHRYKSLVDRACRALMARSRKG
jgi:hypothetical protein